MMSDIGLIKNRLAGLTVLIAEDDEDSMRVATRFLKLAGADILTAENGLAGWEMVRRSHPALVITDLHMPFMDGWQLGEAIKTHEATRDISLIALSADFSSKILSRAIEMGFTGFIRKPLNPSKFVAEILDIIRTIPELSHRLSAIEE